MEEVLSEAQLLGEYTALPICVAFSWCWGWTLKQSRYTLRPHMLFLSNPSVSEARGLCKFFLRNRNTGVNLKPWVLSLSKSEQWWHCWNRIFGIFEKLYKVSWVDNLSEGLDWLSYRVPFSPVQCLIWRSLRAVPWKSRTFSVAGFSFIHTICSHFPVTLSLALWILKAPAALWTVLFEVKFFSLFYIMRIFLSNFDLSFLKTVEEV